MDVTADTLYRFWQALQHGQVPPLGYWNYLLLTFLIVLHGPITTMLGGAAASAGLLNPYLVLVFAMAGNLCADVFWYRAGYASKLDWHNRWLAKRRGRLEGLQRGMRANATRILLMAKLSFGMAVPALAAAGLARVPWRRWFPVVFTGEFIWTGVLLLIGYFATESIKRAERAVLYLSIMISLALLVVIFVFINRKLREYDGQE